jgi:hypothetical protein
MIFRNGGHYGLETEWRAVDGKHGVVVENAKADSLARPGPGRSGLQRRVGDASWRRHHETIQDEAQRARRICNLRRGNEGESGAIEAGRVGMTKAERKATLIYLPAALLRWYAAESKRRYGTERKRNQLIVEALMQFRDEQTAES